MSIPAEGLSAMATATAAIDHGHKAQRTRWRSQSRTKYATPCQECGKTIWVAEQQDGWRMGGTATFESCRQVD